MSTEDIRSLEELLEAGEVEAALLLKGEGWTDGEREIAREAWKAGLAVRRAEITRLQAQIRTLALLVRIGFLVTVDGERATTEIVRDPETRKVLMAILQAKDADAAGLVVIEMATYEEG
jgi:hypothetical protein